MNENKEYIYSSIKDELREIINNSRRLKIVKHNTNFSKLYNQIKDSFNSNNNDYAIFFGYNGSGKKVLIQYVTEKLHQKDNINPYVITIDSNLFNTEIKMINEIYYNLKKIKDFKIDDNNININNLESDKEINEYVDYYLSRFNKYFKQYNIIVYIKNINVFVNARQTFLYTLFNFINNYGNKVFLILSTNDYQFINNLEKRIKSRFNYKEYHFNNYDIDTIYNILANNLKNKSKIINLILDSLSNGILHKELLFRIELGYTIKQVLDLIHKFVIALKLYDKESNLNKDNFVPLATKSLEKVLKGHNFDFKLALLNDLTVPEKIIIVYLSELSNSKSNINSENQSIKYETLINYIKNISSKKHSLNSYNKGTILNFSEEVYKISMIKLYDYGIINLSGLPLNTKSSINLKLSNRLLLKIKEQLNYM